MYRVYLRDEQQRVSCKTTTYDRDAALAAFKNLTDKKELDGQRLLAVLNQDSRPIAHHDFSARPGATFDETKYWRGRTAKIKWPVAIDRCP